MWFQQGEKGRIFVGRVSYQDDLLFSVENFAVQQGINAGWVTIIGALQRAVFGYYDQQAWLYNSITLEEQLEIVSCTGNISMREGKTRGHLHITLGDNNGNLKGGHLMEGSKVFAAEFFIQEIEKISLERTFDEQTGLPLWEKY